MKIYDEIYLSCFKDAEFDFSTSIYNSTLENARKEIDNYNSMGYDVKYLCYLNSDILDKGMSPSFS